LIPPLIEFPSLTQGEADGRDGDEDAAIVVEEVADEDDEDTAIAIVAVAGTVADGDGEDDEDGTAAAVVVDVVVALAGEGMAADEEEGMRGLSELV
jgi:hypothetical protein